MEAFLVDRSRISLSDGATISLREIAILDYVVLGDHVDMAGNIPVTFQQCHYSTHCSRMPYGGIRQFSELGFRISSRLDSEMIRAASCGDESGNALT